VACELKGCVPEARKELIMLTWTLAFFVIALIAGFLGFFGVAGMAATIAKFCFFVFLVLAVIALVTGRRGSVV
jgi:uncharacterized membrane protein YtjA (UPF0391 family)